MAARDRDDTGVIVARPPHLSVRARSGPDRDAPNAPGGARLVPLEPASAVYVLDR